MGKGLRQMILNKLDSETREYCEMISKLAGYSSSSAFRKVMYKEDGDIEKFDGFVKVVHTMFPENKFELMTEFSRTLSPQKLTLRFFLEYTTVYTLRELKLEIITRLKESSNKESNDWAFVYDTELKQAKNEIGALDAINLLSQRKYTSPEMKTYAKFVLFYIHYSQRNIYMMDALYNEIKTEIESLKKKFVKDSYYARLCIMEWAVQLHSKSIGELRQNLFFMESALDPIKSIAYLQIGNSYMITDYEKANKLYKEALEFATEYYQKEVKRSINFNNILWDKFEAYLPDGDKSNELFYYAKKGQVENGKKLLESLDTTNYSDHQLAFNFYYRGLLFNDKNMFYKSVEYFNKCGEKFYKKLPILELQKRGENSYILDALSA